MTTNTQTAPPPGSLYGLPQVNTFFDGKDNNTNVVVTGSQANVTPINSLSPFLQDNVVFAYQLWCTINQTVTLSTGSATASPYFPYNYLQNIAVNMQSSYKPIDVHSGVDLLIFDLIRPQTRWAQTNGGVFAYDSPSSLYQTSLNAYPPFNGGDTPDSETALNLLYNLPVSVYLDDYFDLAADGTYNNSVPIPAVVSPQYMGGNARNVTLSANLASAASSSTDASPFTVVSPATVDFSANLSVRRRGVFNTNNAATSPPIFNWQYSRKTESVNLTGANNNLYLNNVSGQILSFYVRLFDVGTNLPIPITNIESIKVQTGGALDRFDDTASTVQRRFQQQHGYLLPNGVVAYDLAADTDGSGRLTNANAINTLTTASPTVQLTLSSAPSAGSYAIIGYETLVPIVAMGA